MLEYETAIKADNFLVLVHGNAEEMARAKAILKTNATKVDTHGGLKTAMPADDRVHATA